MTLITYIHSQLHSQRYVLNQRLPMSKHIFWGLSGWLILASFQAGLSAQSLSDTTEIIRLKWVNFGPYTQPGQNPDFHSFIPEPQIMALLDTLKPWVEGIRTYDTQYGLDKVPYLAKQRGFKVIVGIWLGKDTLANAVSIAIGIDIANAGYADKVIVGSEVLLRKDLEPNQLIAYINQVKQAIPDSIPVSCADDYRQLLDHPEVVAACDFVAPNIYPFWEGAPIACAMQRFREAYHSLLNLAAGKEIFISESGWKSDGPPECYAEPSLENAIRYNRELLAWGKATGTEINIFSAFDEPWKLLKNDGGWGIFYSDATLKPGMDTLFTPIEAIDSSTWLCMSLENLSTDTLYVDYIPVIGSFLPLKGHIDHLDPCDYRIATYIRVGGWWTKPTYAKPTVPVFCNGRWCVEYASGGLDYQTENICIFLVPSDYSPPLCGNADSDTSGNWIIYYCPTIPAEVYQNAISWKCIQRYVLDSVSITASDESICRGDTSTLTASGGTSYLWSTGETTASIQVSPEKSKTYSVSISDGAGGGAITAITVSVFILDNVSAVPQITCIGDTSVLTVFASGDVTEYLWNTGDTTNPVLAFPDSTTSYTVTITNSAGCTDTDSTTVYVSNDPAAHAKASPDSICIGEYSKISFESSISASYLWSTGVTNPLFYVMPTATSVYAVTVSYGNGCTKVSQTTLTVNPLPATPSIIADSNCVLASTVFLPNGAYLWQKDGQIVGGDTPLLDAKVYGNGFYTVQVTDENGCVAISPLTSVSCVSAVREFDSIFDLRIYPNPNKGRFTVSLKSAEAINVEILCNNLLGQAIFRKEYNLINRGVLETELDLSAIAKGVYIIQVRNNGKSVYRKVTITE